MIRCRTLGPVAVTVNGAPAPAELLWRKHLALLIYLARSPTRGRTRDHLTALLWADKPEPAARHSLREAVRVLRRAVGDDGVTTQGDLVRLNEVAVELDTDQFDTFYGEQRWQDAAALLVGEYLEGFGVPDASVFEDWLSAERSAWRERSVDVLVKEGERQLQLGNTVASAAAAQRATTIDPLSAKAVRLLMCGSALEDDRATALKSYERYAARLAEAGSAGVDRETAALMERVRQGREWRLPIKPAAVVARAESRRAPLVGRDSQLPGLLDAWAAARERRRAALGIIAADSGMGKTRLADEVVARARLDGAAVSTLRAVPGDLENPYGGLIGLARGGLLESAGLASAEPGAIAALATQLPDWADRFRAVVRGVSPWPLTPAVSEALRAVAEQQPLLLFVDDVQWLDSESLNGLGAVLRDLAGLPVMLLITTGQSAGRVELDQLRVHVGRDLAGVVVSLTPLAMTSIQQLARWAFPNYSDPDVDRVARRVMTDSAGLPLFAVELLHAVSLGLSVDDSASAWPQPFRTLDQTLPGELPDALVAAIRMGFQRLTQNARRALSALSVLSDRASGDLVGRAADMTGEPLRDALDELEWNRWVTAEPRGYAFVARIVRDVIARDMVTPGQRHRMQDAIKASSAAG